MSETTELPDEISEASSKVIEKKAVDQPAEVEVTDPAFQKATDYLRQYQDATDNSRREQIKAAVKNDPEMQALFRDHADLLREKGMADLLPDYQAEGEVTSPTPEITADTTNPETIQTEEIDLLPIREADGQLDLKLTSLVTLANEAIVNRAPTASVIFDSELDNIKNRLDAARSSTETPQTFADLQTSLTELVNLFDKVESVFDNRFRQLIGGYYGGNPPDGLSAQAKLFTEAKQEIDRLKKYLRPA
jgi:hypothetical protein